MPKSANADAQIIARTTTLMRSNKAAQGKLKGKDIDSVVDGNADQSSQANSSKHVRESDVHKSNRRTDYEFSTRTGMFEKSGSKRQEVNDGKAATLQKKLTIQIDSASKEYESVEGNNEDYGSSNNDYSEGNSRQDLIFNKENTPVDLKDEDMVKDQLK